MNTDGSSRTIRTCICGAEYAEYQDYEGTFPSNRCPRCYEMENNVVNIDANTLVIEPVFEYEYNERISQ
jgi:hypothetical protein